MVEFYTSASIDTMRGSLPIRLSAFPKAFRVATA